MQIPSQTASSGELAARLHQQELVASFGLLALSRSGVGGMLDEACIVAARGLQTRLAKVLRYRPDSQDFLVVAGVGWRPGVVGHAVLQGGAESPAGYAVLSHQPVVCAALAEDRRFRMPALLTEHSVQSAINVIIGPVGGEVYGVLEADSTLRNEFTATDAAFLQSLANVLAAAIARANAEALKDRLLLEKDLLMQEVHHRVKNNLHLVQAMLLTQARTAGQETRRQLEEAVARIMTIGAVHHRLYVGQSVEQTDLREFLLALRADMQAMLSQQGAARALRVQAPSIQLPAEIITRLGLVVTELVTNATKYGDGVISVVVVDAGEELCVTVEDGGAGFPADFDPAVPAGLGMRMIGAMASVVPGSISIDRSVAHGRISVLVRR